MKLILFLFIATFSLHGQTILTSPYHYNQAHFGSYLSSSDNHLVVSAEYSNQNEDTVYVFEKNAAGNWVHQQNIFISDPQSPSQLAVSEVRGNELLIGKGNVAGNGTILSGKVYYYRLLNGTWQLEQQISAPSPQSWESFGFSLSLHGDYLAIGALGSVIYSVPASVYLYKKTNGQWSFQQKLQSNSSSSSINYAYNLDMFGNSLIVSAGGDPTDANGNNPINYAGAAYLYMRDTNDIWVEVEKLVSRNRSAGDAFALDVAISDKHLALAYPFDGYDDQDQNYRRRSGSIYLYKKVNKQWQFQKKLLLGQRNNDDCFGYSLELLGDSLLVNSRRDIQSSLVANNNTEIRDIISLYNLNTQTTLWQDTLISLEHNRVLVNAPLSLNASGFFVGQVGYDSAGTANAGAVYYVAQNSIGISESLPEHDLKLYPNPAHDYITISLPAECQLVKDWTVNIIASDGQIVRNSNFNSLTPHGEYAIDLARFPAGLYVIQMTNAKNNLRSSFLKTCR